MKTQRLPAGRRSRPTNGRWFPTLLLALTLGVVWYGGEPTGFTDRETSGETKSAIVTTDNLNLRTGPSSSHPVVAVLREGEIVTLTGIANGDYLLVLSSATSGWAASQYLERNAPDRGSEAQAMERPGSVVNDAPESRAADITSSVPTSVPNDPVSNTEPERWINVDRSDATVSLMQGDAAVAVFPGRIGRDPAVDGFYSTAIGTFHVYAMNKDLSPTPFAEDTWLTDWVGFDPVRKNGIHSPVRSSDGTVRE
ncbi:MAG TPA: SH3 domain-containing protein, partial [Thermomicrobiales bacterium]|nr:SH3 domain-containing protein [Thermomicrobiales bacterium]